MKIICHFLEHTFRIFFYLVSQNWTQVSAYGYFTVLLKPAYKYIQKP